jgi:hypothetical protein
MLIIDASLREFLGKYTFGSAKGMSGDFDVSASTVKAIFIHELGRSYSAALITMIGGRPQWSCFTRDESGFQFR